MVGSAIVWCLRGRTDMVLDPISGYDSGAPAVYKVDSDALSLNDRSSWL